MNFVPAQYRKLLLTFGAFIATLLLLPLGVQAAPVTVSLSVTPSSVVAGVGKVQVTWSSTNATSCTIVKEEGLSNGIVYSSSARIEGPRGSYSINAPLFDPTTFRLTCSSPVNGSASTSKTIKVIIASGSAPGGGLCGQVLGCVSLGPILLPCSIFLSSNKTSVTPGESATLSWSSLFANSNSIINYGPVTPTSNTAGVVMGAVSVSPTQTTTYTGQCEWGGVGIIGPVGGTVSSAPVTITVSNPAITGSCSASPSSITIGGSTTWTANASGGNGTYTYSWNGTDSLSGSSRTVNKTYTSAGTKTATVTVTSGGSSQNINCSNSVSVSNPPPQCSDGIDNDGDGRIDLADYGCTTSGGGGNPANDPSESPNPQCSDGIDNNGNGLIDTADVGACTGPTDGNEQPLPGSTLSLTAPALVRPASAVTLTWSASNIRAGTCTLVGTNGDSWNLTGTSGTRTSSALVSEAVFTLACTDLNSQPQSTTVTVRVTPSFEEI